MAKKMSIKSKILLGITAAAIGVGIAFIVIKKKENTQSKDVTKEELK